MKNRQNHKRKMGIAVLAGLAITGIIGASAASIGVIDERSLGAGVEVVASCDTDGVTVTYDASYDADSGVVELNEATIGGVDINCNTLAYEVTVTDSAGLALGRATGIVAVAVAPADSFTVDFTETLPTDPGVDAEDVTGIAITIYGSNA